MVSAGDQCVAGQFHDRADEVGGVWWGDGGGGGGGDCEGESEAGVRDAEACCDRLGLYCWCQKFDLV